MIQLEKKHARYKKHHEFVAVAIVAPARVLCVQRLVLPSTKMIHYRKIGLVAHRPSRSLEFPYQKCFEESTNPSWGARNRTRLPGRSFTNAKRNARKTPLETGELPEQGRCNSVKYVVRILVIRGVEGKDPQANLAAFGTIQERYVQRDVPVDLCVQ